MSNIKEYLFALVVILFCINVSWSIDVPKIVKLKRLVSRKNKEHRVLQCVAKGVPRPTLSWTFNGQKIPDNDHYDFKNDNSIITVNDVTSDDSGNYRCYASNTFGMIFAQMQIKIVGTGEFKEGFTKEEIPLVQNVTIGKPAELKCPPHSDQPGQIYAWAIPPLEFLYPGKPIERVFISDNHGSLYFSFITQSDIDLINRKGGVSCILYEDYTNLESSRKITLRSDGQDTTENAAPQMVVFMRNKTIGIEGDKKVLLCGATGKPHPVFQWYKDGELISLPGGESSTRKNVYFDGKGMLLQMNNIKKDDAGIYKCVAENSEGTDSKYATFIVDSKVKWTQQLPEIHSVPVKKSITLKCAAEGIPTPKFVWYHNNSIIGNSSRRTIKDGTMEIPVTDFDDCGMYLCAAENYLNTIVSPVYVTIEDVPPVFTKELNSLYYFLQGGHYNITCDATGGPEPTIKWYQNNRLITNSEHVTVKPDKKLLFKDVKKDQHGVYKCVAENRKAKVESSGVVKVFVKTSITKHPGDVRYNAGRSAYLFCDATVDKTLKATWQWIKDGKVIDYNDRVYLKDLDRTDKKISSHTLKVKDIEAEDAGKYTCNVFTVDDATFRSGDSASGSITVITAPLAVGNLKIAGTFEKGKKTDSKKPDGGGKKTDPTKEPLSDGVVTLSWDAPNKYVGPAEKYIIEYAKANSSDWNQYDPPNKFEGTSVKLDKDKLPASSDLVFRIRAVATDDGKEMVGEPSDPTEAGSLVTPVRAPEVNPSNVRLEIEDDGNVTVAWDKLDKVDQPGPGFKIVGAYREIKPNKTGFTNFTKDGDYNSAEGPVASEDGEDKVYEVLIKSKNDAGSGPEQRIIMKVPGKAVRQKVAGVTLVSVTSKGATITWNEVDGATGYRIYYTKTDSRRRRRSTQVSTDVTENKATLSDLKPGSLYEITVAATNIKGEGPKSDPLPVATKKGVPGVPSGVDLDTYADTIRLGWAPPNDPDIKNYTVTWYPKDSPNDKKTMVVSGDEQQAFITDKDLDPQTYYTVEVAAISDEGEGEPWKMEGVVIGEPDAPGKPAPPLAEAINDTMINVTFKLPTTYYGGLPETFKICYSKDKCIESTYPDTPYVVFDSLDYTQTYEFWSIAKNDKGEGEKSETVKQKPLDPPTTVPPPTTSTTTETPPPTNETVVVVVAGSTSDDEKAFYEELWFIILLIILLILIIIAIILCIICNRRGGRYPVGKKEKDYGGWDKDPMKDYSDSAVENGAGLPLVSPTRSPGQDSLKKPPFQDDEDEDSLDDYGEGYGDIGQYGTETKKETNGQTLC